MHNEREENASDAEKTLVGGDTASFKPLRIDEDDEDSEEEELQYAVKAAELQRLASRARTTIGKSAVGVATCEKNAGSGVNATPEPQLCTPLRHPRGTRSSPCPSAAAFLSTVFSNTWVDNLMSLPPDTKRTDSASGVELVRTNLSGTAKAAAHHRCHVPLPQGSDKAPARERPRQALWREPNHHPSACAWRARARGSRPQGAGARHLHQPRLRQYHNRPCPR